jgi:hypothetical protein
MKRVLTMLVLLVTSGFVLAQDQGRNGSWFYVVESDPLDERPVIKLGSPAMGSQGRFIVFCEGLFTEQIAVDWQSYIGFEAETLKYKFDDHPAVLTPAVTSRNGQAVLFKDHAIFDAMQNHQRLYIRAQSGERQTTKTLTFDLKGFNEVIQDTAPNCTMSG